MGIMVKGNNNNTNICTQWHNMHNIPNIYINRLHN